MFQCFGGIFRKSFMYKVSFGTDGWRGIIARDFTFDNVRVVTQAISSYVKKTGEGPLIIGYDTRFFSDRYAMITAEVIRGNGIPVILSDRPISTPVLSYSVKNYNASGGIMITASHNPYYFNGIKYKASYGGSAFPAITSEIETLIGKERPKVLTGIPSKKDLLPSYKKHISSLIDMERIKDSGISIIFDPMYGTAGGVLEELLSGKSCKVKTIHNWMDPLFGGLHPEPLKENLKDLKNEVLKNKASVGLATDGDADRLGVISPSGEFIESHKIFGLLLLHLIRNRGWKGDVVKTISTTLLIDRIAAKLGLGVYETPVGFKHICELMLKGDILIGGEESGGIGIKNHIPERDGLLAGLLLLEMMATESKSLQELLDLMEEEFGRLHYSRVDFNIAPDEGKKLVKILRESPPDNIIGRGILDIKIYDGLKFILEGDSWVLLRPSGTEPVLRVYAEAQSTEDVKRIIDFGKEVVLGKGRYRS